MKLFTNKFLLCALALALGATAAYAAPQTKDAAASAATLQDANCAEIDALIKKYPTHHITPCTAAQRAREAKAGPAAQKDYLSCFAAWDKKLNTLQTGFTQITEYDGVLISRSEGRIFYAKNPARLRLDNLQDGAVNQSALTDKKMIYVLDENQKRVSELTWDEWLQGQPNQALYDFGNYSALLARHDAAEFERKEGLVLLRLTPKDKKQNYTLYMAIGEEDCFPAYITIQSDLMQTTATLTNARQNQTLKKDVFKGLKK